MYAYIHIIHIYKEREVIFYMPGSMLGLIKRYITVPESSNSKSNLLKFHYECHTLNCYLIILKVYIFML